MSFDKIIIMLAQFHLISAIFPEHPKHQKLTQIENIRQMPPNPISYLFNLYILQLIKTRAPRFWLQSIVFSIFKQQQTRTLNKISNQNYLEKLKSINPQYLQYQQSQQTTDNLKMTSSLSLLRSYKPKISNRKPYYLLSSIIIAGLLIGYALDMPYIIIFFLYGILPMLDQYTSQDWDNPSLKEIKELENMFKFKLVLYITVLFQWIAYYLIHILVWKMSLFKGIGLAFLAINLFGASFMLSHQLIHKGLTDKIIGTLDQIKSLYGHFTIQHVYGHHKKVSTPSDPASAPKGMTVYQFLVKSIVGSYKSSFHINPTVTLLFTISSFVFLFLVYCRFQLRGLLLSLVFAAGAVLMLEIINYVQHYGLSRRLLPDGTYEKVTIRHSWNAPHRFSNYLLFKLQRHSDHHQNAMKPYQTLCSYEASPQLPHGYLVCIIMAIFPNIWFDVMDPLVDQYNKQDKVKGSQLQQMKISEKKTLQFVLKVRYLVGSLAVVQLLGKAVDMIMG